MEIVELNINDVIPYKNNPIKHDDVQKIKTSIEKFGFRIPIIIDKNNVIVCGHGRVLAAKELNIKTVPCIYASDMTDEQVKAFRLVDNKVAESPDWDMELLLQELDGLDLDEFDWGLEEEEEPEKKEIVKPEVPFTEVLGEEHNYIVLYFDNEVDWLQLLSIIDVEERRNLSTRKDGKVTKSMARKSLGRVFKGSEVLESMRRHYENIN